MKLAPESLMFIGLAALLLWLAALPFLIEYRYQKAMTQTRGETTQQEIKEQADDQ